MAGLRAAARELLQRLPHVEALSAPAVTAAAARADAHGPGVELPLRKDYNAIAARVTATLQHGRALSRADLRDAAWCLWHTRPALMDDDKVFAAYVRAVMRMDQIRPYRSLASSYLLQFRRDIPQFALVARALAVQAPKAGLPWGEAHDVYGLFDPDTAIRRLTDRAMQRGVRPGRLLEEVRLGRLPRGAGLLTAVHQTGLERLRAQENRDPLARLAAVALWATHDDGGLISDQLASLATDALLAPFRGETPDREIRDPYVRLILALFGDPRLTADWRGANPKNEAIVRRWLTEQSLRMFLDVVGRVSPPDLWDHRRAFWESLYRASLVDDAWVVFEGEGAAAATKSFGEQVSFARFDARAEPARGIAVLMLKIGSLLVVDWSHGGPCAIWDTATEPAAPPIYRATYDPARLRKTTRGPDTLESHAAEGVFWHAGLSDYAWQDQIAAYLRTAKDIRLTKVGYRI